MRPRAGTLLIAAMLCSGCGKKGPPLPPLVRLPVAPPEIVAERRAADVDVRITIPATNTDGTRPANISRIDVYAVTGPASLSDADLLRYGTRIGSFEVKSPRNPDQAVDANDPDEEIEPPEGPGLDQGATVEVSEALTPDLLAPSGAAAPSPGVPVGQGPLLAPSTAVPLRTYAAVGVSTSGRRGPLSKRVTVPLVAPPPRVLQPDVTYDEKGVTVAWSPARAAGPAQADNVLPSRPLVEMSQPTIAYNVYDMSNGDARLTNAPVDSAMFVDSRMEWGAERCYAVRAVDTIDGLRVEGEASAPRCVTLVDTFPPAAPRNPQTIPSEGGIYLIWDANAEPDLAGYVVVRGESPDQLTPITPSPIQAPTFRDVVAAGTRAFYAVRAVDKAGNVGPLSAAVQETAR